MYIRDKRPKEAIAVLNRVLSEGIKDTSLYLALGYAYSADSRDADALKYYRMALDMSPDSALVRFHLGAYYDRMKERPLAVSEFREAIRLDSKFSDAYNYLGYMYAEEGTNLDEAAALIKKAIKLEPDNGAYIDSLGWAYFQDDKFSEALIELVKAAKLEPDDPTIKEHLKRAKEKLKKKK